jgi:alpha-galactosidase
MLKEKLDEQRVTLEQEIRGKKEFVNWISDRAPRFSDDPFTWSFFEQYNVVPLMLDRHASEFFPERFPGGSYYGKRLGVDAFPIDKRIAWGDDVYLEMERLARSADPLPETFFQQVPGEHEQLLEMMNSLRLDKRETFSVNVPNKGAVENLPDDAVIEIPASATARGFCQLHAGRLPDVLATMLLRKLSSIELTVEAALKGDYNLFVEALIADGAVNDKTTAKRLADDLIGAHAQHLPQFAA